MKTSEDLNFYYVEYYSSAYMYFALWTKNTSNNKLGQPTATRSSLKCKKANKRPLDCVHSTSFFSVPSDFLLVCPTESDNMVKPRIRWFFINYPFLSKSIYWIYCHRKASFFRKCTFSWYHVGCTCIFGKSVAGSFFQLSDDEHLWGASRLFWLKG